MDAPVPDRPPGHPPPRDLLALLAAQVGEHRAARLRTDVLADDDAHAHAEIVRFLGGDAGRSLLEDGTSWKPYWSRVWAARGLLYVWDDDAASVVLDRLRDEHWRVAEMCLKVSVRHELPCGDEAVRLAGHELPRVRTTAARAIGGCGDTEHAGALVDLADDPSADVRRAAARARERLESRLDL